MTCRPAPLVSVVIPVYNVEKYVAEAIESILGQTFSDFEFIIVDDGSADRSGEIIRSYAACDDRIRCVMLEQNSGEASARNRGLEQALGEFVACMDCDDVSLPARLQKQVEFLRANPAIGAVGTEAMLTDENLDPQGVYGVAESHARIAYDLQMGPCVVGASIMMRRKIVQACGGYDESVGRSTDIELVARLIPRTRLANLLEPLYLYRQHEGQLPGKLQNAQDWANLLAQLLSRLGGEAPQASFERFAQVRRRERLNWRERRLAKRDLTRLIDSMVAANWIDEGDRAHLTRVLNGQMERTTPRLWQMFCHWRRHHFGPGKWEAAVRLD
ncbi:MAG: glycosyltransferase family 2 protein [Chloroflexi bacterium]|nr:glycosyltransferase family 2 protein [Chloroflexota bacterium]